MKRILFLGIALALAGCQPSVQPSPSTVEPTPQVSEVAPTQATSESSETTAQVTPVALPEVETGMAIASSDALVKSCGYTASEQNTIQSKVMAQHSVNEEQYALYLEKHSDEAQQNLKNYRNELDGDDWEKRCSNLKPFLLD